jgi:hypothetical protein
MARGFRESRKSASRYIQPIAKAATTRAVALTLTTATQRICMGEQYFKFCGSQEASEDGVTHHAALRGDMS